MNLVGSLVFLYGTGRRISRYRFQVGALTLVGLQVFKSMVITLIRIIMVIVLLRLLELLMLLGLSVKSASNFGY